MIELIVIIILIASLLGIGVILFQKIPVLAELPEIAEGVEKESFFARLKEKIKNLPAVKSFSSEIFLQKILSKVRILTLKADNKTFSWIQKLREKYKKKQAESKDKYWEELKNSINQEKKT